MVVVVVMLMHIMVMGTNMHDTSIQSRTHQSINQPGATRMLSAKRYETNPYELNYKYKIWYFCCNTSKVIRFVPMKIRRKINPPLSIPTTLFDHTGRL